MRKQWTPKMMFYLETVFNSLSVCACAWGELASNDSTTSGFNVQSIPKEYLPLMMDNYRSPLFHLLLQINLDAKYFRREKILQIMGCVGGLLIANISVNDFLKIKLIFLSFGFLLLHCILHWWWFSSKHNFCVLSWHVLQCKAKNKLPVFWYSIVSYWTIRFSFVKIYKSRFQFRNAKDMATKHSSQRYKFRLCWKMVIKKVRDLTTIYKPFKPLNII